MQSTFLILIDESSPESLTLVQALQRAGQLDRIAEGMYEVTGCHADVRS